MTILRLTLGAALVLATACATTPGRKSAQDIPYPEPQSPEWVAHPAIQGGLAVTECANDTAPSSILKRKTTSLARAALAEELRISADSMIRTQQESAASEGASSWSEDSQTTINQMATETLRNSRIARSDYVTVRGKSQFCTMVVIEKDTADQLRDEIFKTSGLQVSPDDKSTLWQAFLRTGKEIDMESELAR